MSKDVKLNSLYFIENFKIHWFEHFFMLKHYVFVATLSHTDSFSHKNLTTVHTKKWYEKT